MDRLLHDVRHALRLMARHPGFTSAALVTLALGIGTNTAIFSIVYGVLIRPLPYRDAGRLIRVWEEHPGATSAVRAPLLSNRTFHGWRESPQTIDSIAAFRRTAYTLTGAGEPARVTGAEVHEPVACRHRRCSHLLRGHRAHRRPGPPAGGHPESEPAGAHRCASVDEPAGEIASRADPPS